MSNLNKINGNKDLYDRACCLLADHEQGRSKAKLLDQYQCLVYDILQTCVETEKVKKDTWPFWYPSDHENCDSDHCGHSNTPDK